MSEWVSAEERLPYAGTEVLACRVGKKKTFGPFFVRKTGNHLQPWRYLDGDRCEVTPTHWMPLPEPPK